MQTIIQNIQVTLEEPWDYLNLCMDLLTLESYLLIIWQSGCLKQASLNLNVRCLYIISMQHMEQRLLFYLMLMIVYIGILLKILDHGFWALYKRYSMWTSWDMHIGSCQSEFCTWRTVPFQYIRLDMLILLWISICIILHSIQVQIVL